MTSLEVTQSKKRSSGLPLWFYMRREAQDGITHHNHKRIVGIAVA